MFVFKTTHKNMPLNKKVFHVRKAFESTQN